MLNIFFLNFFSILLIKYEGSNGISPNNPFNSTKLRIKNSSELTNLLLVFFGIFSNKEILILIPYSIFLGGKKKFSHFIDKMIIFRDDY